MDNKTKNYHNNTTKKKLYNNNNRNTNAIFPVLYTTLFSFFHFILFPSCISLSYLCLDVVFFFLLFFEMQIIMYFSHCSSSKIFFFSFISGEVFYVVYVVRIRYLYSLFFGHAEFLFCPTEKFHAFRFHFPNNSNKNGRENRKVKTSFGLMPSVRVKKNYINETDYSLFKPILNWRLTRWSLVIWCVHYDYVNPLSLKMKTQNDWNSKWKSIFRLDELMNVIFFLSFSFVPLIETKNFIIFHTECQSNCRH